MTIALPAETTMRPPRRLDLSWPILILFAAVLCMLIVLQMSWLVYFSLVDRDGAFTLENFGKLFTDPAQHALTKIPGEVTFSLDLRSVQADLLVELEQRLVDITREVAQRRGVAFELGPATRAQVGEVDQKILRSLTEGAKQLGISARAIASGASHDAATFAQRGIPMGMIFVRNAHGSHNPAEAMTIEDFAAAARVLIEVVMS